LTRKEKIQYLRDIESGFINREDLKPRHFEMNILGLGVEGEYKINGNQVDEVEYWCRWNIKNAGDTEMIYYNGKPFHEFYGKSSNK